MKKPQVWHYHYDKSEHARKHLHFGGRVRHEHVNLHGYGQLTSTLYNNEKDSDRRRVKYFGRSTPSRIDAETAMNPKHVKHVQEMLDGAELVYDGLNYYFIRMNGNKKQESTSFDSKAEALKAYPRWVTWFPLNNPGAKRHSQIARALYQEARAEKHKGRKAVLQIRAAEHAQAVIESEIDGVPNPGNDFIDNRQTGVWDSSTLTEILRQLRRLVNKSGKKALIVTRDSSKGIAEARGATTGKLFLRAMQVHGGWIVRWDGKLIQRKEHNPTRNWHLGRYRTLSDLSTQYPTDKELKGQVQEERVALHHNPEGEIDISYGMTNSPGKAIHISTSGNKSLCGLELHKMIVSSDVARIMHERPLCQQCKIKLSDMLGGSHPAIFNPEIDIKCGFCGKTIRSIKTAKLIGNKLYHPECVKLIKKVQGVSNPLVDVDECPKCHRKRGERHKATMKAPSVKTMEKWSADCRSKATDGCWVEPDGTCPHGHSSWMKVLLGI